MLGNFFLYSKSAVFIPNPHLRLQGQIGVKRSKEILEFNIYVLGNGDLGCPCRLPFEVQLDGTLRIPVSQLIDVSRKVQGFPEGSIILLDKTKRKFLGLMVH